MVELQTRTNEPYPKGIENLKRMIGKCVRSVTDAQELSLETEVFDSSKTLEQLCLNSGSHVRNLVPLVQTAINTNILHLFKSEEFHECDHLGLTQQPKRSLPTLERNGLKE